MTASPRARCFVVAEVGSVHDGSFGNAKRLIDVAAECGADAVKFQTHIAAAETTRDAPTPPYFRDEPRYDYFERTAFSREQWRPLREHAEGRGVEFLSSPFSTEAVILLEDVGMRRYKIPSGEVTNVPLLEAVAATGKPVLLSSGMSSWDELDRAVAALRRSSGSITVLQCTSEYPCPPEHVGLNVMIDMRERYGLPVGLSDHTLSAAAAYAAVALGATVIEKHITFSRRMYGSDAAHSMEPEEFAAMVRGIREIEVMLTHPVDKSDTGPFRQMKAIFEKSVVALADVPAGAVFSPSVLGVRKPGTGLAPRFLADVVGRRAARDVRANTPLTSADVVWDAGMVPPDEGRR